MPLTSSDFISFWVYKLSNQVEWALLLIGQPLQTKLTIFLVIKQNSTKILPFTSLQFYLYHRSPASPLSNLIWQDKIYYHRLRNLSYSKVIVSRMPYLISESILDNGTRGSAYNRLFDSGNKREKGKEFAHIYLCWIDVCLSFQISENMFCS